MPPISSSRPVPIRVYVSYAHEDAALLAKLKNHLSVLKREKVIAQWDDQLITAGEDTADSIRRNFEAAQVILLLVSADFLASDALWELGVSGAIARHDAGTAKVVPIILRPCDWETAPL